MYDDRVTDLPLKLNVQEKQNTEMASYFNVFDVEQLHF